MASLLIIIKTKIITNAIKPIMLLGLFNIALLSACSSVDLNSAPVIDRTDKQNTASNTVYNETGKPINYPINTHSGDVGNMNNQSVSYRTLPLYTGATHIVRKSDTLYSIALEYGLNYLDLAQWNGLADPSYIQVGQVLRLTPSNMINSTVPNVSKSVYSNTIPNNNTVVHSMPIRLPNTAVNEVVSVVSPVVVSTPQKSTEVSNKPIAKSIVNATPIQKNTGLIWQWPVSNRVISSYNDSQKGIDFSGAMGDSVFAAADGKVIYSGVTLKGYGKMVLIKHNDMYLTVYAHNSKLLVKEGDWVKRGQKIAEMGNSETENGKVMMHFELRRNGKPIDPNKLLPEK